MEQVLVIYGGDNNDTNIETKLYEIRLGIALQSNTINALIEYTDNEDFKLPESAVPLPSDTNEKALEDFIEYANWMYDNKEMDITEINKWRDEYINSKTIEEVHYIIKIANYLDYNSLLDIGCKNYANLIDNATSPEEIRQIFNIPDDLTEDEKKEILEELSFEIN